MEEKGALIIICVEIAIFSVAKHIFDVEKVINNVVSQSFGVAVLLASRHFQNSLEYFIAMQ